MTLDFVRLNATGFPVFAGYLYDHPDFEYEIKYSTKFNAIKLDINTNGDIENDVIDVLLMLFKNTS